MKNKNKFMLLIVLYCVCMVSQGHATEPLELVTLQYPPYEYEEDGEVKGIAVEVIREVFKRMEQPITITLLPWARALSYIELGKADAIFTAYKTPERETFADYSTEVLMPQVVSLFVLKDSPIKFDGDLRALNQFMFGVVRKVSYGAIFDEAVKQNVITRLTDVNTGEQNMEMLLRGRIDILVSNKYGALDIFKKMGELGQVRELQPELESVPSYIAFSKQRQLTAVRDRFDLILRAMKEDGTYQHIIDTYFTKE